MTSPFEDNSDDVTATTVNDSGAMIVNALNIQSKYYEVVEKYFFYVELVRTVEIILLVERPTY